MAKKSNPSFKRYILIVIISVALGFAIAYITSILKVSADQQCQELCIIESSSEYGLPLPFRSVGNLATETINYTNFVFDGLACSALVFVVIFIPTQLVNRRKRAQ